MLLRLCQLKTLLLCLSSLCYSCAYFRQDKDAAVELFTMITPHWFKANPEHALHDTNGLASPHLFFDVNPEFVQRRAYANVVIMTPEDSAHAYDLDISSGQRFYTHSYCPQSDVWKKTTGLFERPIYSTAYLPRTLDQQGDPQKVIVFGVKDKFGDQSNPQFYPVRLVGAFLEQTCPEMMCQGKDNWVSKLVFIAVDANDKKLEKVKDLESFMASFNWEQIQAYLENIDGQNGELPYNMVGKLISFDHAYDYFQRNSVQFESKDLNKIVTGCHKLYEKLWQDVGAWRPEDRPVTNSEEMKAKAKLISELRKSRLPVGFHARLINFSNTYYDDFNTCGKFVYRGNFNVDQEKFWFLSYMGIFFRLHKEGYYFNCNQKSWQKNMINRQGQPIFEFKQGIRMCSDKDIDAAMASLPNFLKTLKSEKNYFRFIDYDTHSMGTHRKIYSWVKVRNNHYNCSEDPNQLIRKELLVSPEDAGWIPRSVKDATDQLKVIF